MVCLLVRYGEIALKSIRIRKRFSSALIENIENAFVRTGRDCIVREEWGRIFIETGDPQAAAGILSNMFGIVSFSEVEQVPAEQKVISEKAVELLKGKLDGPATFAVRCRRKGSHKFTSQEMAAWVGSDILDALPDEGLKVNLSAPRHTVEVEIRESRAYVFMDRVPGPGGFPLGTQGYVYGIVEVEDLDRAEEIVLAFYLLMKRGCRVNPGFIFEEGENREKVEIIIEHLARFDPKTRANYLPGLIDPDGNVDQEAFPGGGALVSARGLQKGLVKSSPVPVFYPLIALEDEVINAYRDWVFPT